MKSCRTILLFALLLVSIGFFAGCATVKPQPSAYRGPMEEPKQDTFWWELFGWVAVPVASAFSDR